MSREDVMNEIIKPMQALFLPPRSMADEQITGALEQYADALQDFSGVDLQASWCKVRDEHTARSWPPVASFVLAARLSRRDRNPLKERKERDDTNERWEMWKKIRTTALALEAMEFGVAWSLKCAILDGKKPDQISISALMQAKAMATATADKIEAGTPLPSGVTAGASKIMAGSERALALDMWRNLQLKEAETAEEIGRFQQAAGQSKNVAPARDFWSA